eukprot:c13079_g1_i1 orf=355-546(+)
MSDFIHGMWSGNGHNLFHFCEGVKQSWKSRWVSLYMTVGIHFGVKRLVQYCKLNRAIEKQQCK